MHNYVMSENCCMVSVIFKTVLERLDAGCGGDRTQLGDGSIMEAFQTLGLRQACLDEFGIETPQIGQNDEFDKVGGIADVPSRIGVIISGHAKKHDVDEVRFAGVGEARVVCGQLSVDEILLDCVCMDLVRGGRCCLWKALRGC